MQSFAVQVASVGSCPSRAEGEGSRRVSKESQDRSKDRGVRQPPGRGRRLFTVAAATVTAVVSTAVIANAVGPGSSQSTPAEINVAGAPDMILYNGRISTVDRANTVVQALAIRDGEILATGRSGPIKALAKRGTKLVDLDGRRVLPGLIDGHIHGMRNGYHCYTQTVRLDLVTSRSAALADYAAKASQLADAKWIWTTSGGWNVNQLDDPRMFTFAELTQAAPDNPVWIQTSGLPAARAGTYVNQAAIDRLSAGANTPGVEKGQDGTPTGRILGNSTALNELNAAIYAQLDGQTLEAEAKCLSDFIREANRRGMTAFKDAGGNMAPWRATPAGINEGLHIEEPTMYLYRQGGLNARIAYNAMSNYEGPAKVIADTRNAVGFLGDDMLRYLGPGEDTMPEHPEYRAYTEHSAAKRLSVETHRGTLDLILNGFEAANNQQKARGQEDISDLKWRIAHPEAGEPNAAQVARGEELGIGWALTFSSVRNGSSGPRFRSTMESGSPMCLASDAMNVAPWAPFQNLWYVTTGQTLVGQPGVPADQRLTREEALRHATVDCGWFIDQEGRVGSLEPGNHADLIVLTEDYFTVPDESIKDLRSVMTVVGGRVVHAEGEFAAANTARAKKRK
jgi:predicted amidohydrolase YtcJ